MRSGVRDVDSVGRYGGDEFLVVCPGVADANEADEIGKRLASAVNTDTRLSGVDVRIRASVGVAYTHERMEPHRLLEEADRAMYRGKNR